jgi:hypothetical protein
MHSELSAQIRARVYDDPQYKKLNGTYQFGLHEVARCAMDDIWHRHCEWRNGPASGPVRTAIKDAWTEQMSELARTPGALYGGHFWKNSDRPYTEYKATNAAKG